VLKRSLASLLVAIGVNSKDYREILGICEGAKVDKAGWSSFLTQLKECDLVSVQNSPRQVRFGDRKGRWQTIPPACGWNFSRGSPEGFAW
jgi:hypothetical protein